jgi:predicted GNAT superfamily acetyltransferase
MSTAEITIREAATPADYRACQEAQRRAWGLNDEGYVVPVATLVGAQLHGGLVLGAFLPSGEAVGVSFAFLGRIEHRLGLYSQLTGVVPGYQGHGVGRRLKQYQRDVARQRGLELIAWAFDPLQAGNARFNLDRLGATAGRYVVDMYGSRTDALNAGAPTDRLIVEWETAAVVPRTAGDPASLTSLPPLIEHGRVTLPPAAPAVFLEIPADITRLRRESPAQAEAWQSAVRDAFQRAFAAGYRAVRFACDAAPARCGYVLERGRDQPVRA